MERCEDFSDGRVRRRGGTGGGGRFFFSSLGMEGGTYCAPPTGSMVNVVVDGEVSRREDTVDIDGDAGATETAGVRRLVATLSIDAILDLRPSDVLTGSGVPATVIPGFGKLGCP